jgi:hypothetical protein
MAPLNAAALTTRPRASVRAADTASVGAEGEDDPWPPRSACVNGAPEGVNAEAGPGLLTLFSKSLALTLFPHLTALSATGTRRTRMER